MVDELLSMDLCNNDEHYEKLLSKIETTTSKIPSQHYYNNSDTQMFQVPKLMPKLMPN